MAYQEALSAYNSGKFEEAFQELSKCEPSPMVQGLLKECKKQIVEQYAYLINDARHMGGAAAQEAYYNDFLQKYGENERLKSLITKEEFHQPTVQPSIQPSPEVIEIEKEYSFDELAEKYPIINYCFCGVFAAIVLIIGSWYFFYNQVESVENQITDLESDIYHIDQEISERASVIQMIQK